MKDRMFVVPGEFVPQNDTVTLLTYKRLRNLDLDIDVFSLKGIVDEDISEELNNDSEFKKFNIKESVDFEWTVPRNHPMRLPASIFFMRKYVQDSLKEFEKKEYKYLFTSIVPGISHIAGYYIKKKHPDVIWYASFSDPFKGSPYKDNSSENNNIIYNLMFEVGSFSLYNNRYEEVAINNADKLVFICEEQKDFTLKQYPNYDELNTKSIIMPLTYISEWKMYSDLIQHKNNTDYDGKLAAVHLGRLYGLRRIDSFLDALYELKQEDDNLSDKIVFHQYSEIQSDDIKKINEYGLNDLFVIHDKVSYKKSIEIMKQSDILVLFDTLMPGKSIQPYLPSKIVEYLLLQKPILGICESNSPSYRILKENNQFWVGSSKEEIKNNIKNLISNKPIVNNNVELYDSNGYNMLEL